MVVKVYLSGISANKEVKKRQQRVILILDSKNIKYEVIDIAEPGNEEQKDFMHNNSKSLGTTISDPTPRHPLPPQIFNDDVYCGDYDQFDMANEVDEMEKFLKLVPDDGTPTATSNAEVKLGNGVSAQKDGLPEAGDNTAESKPDNVAEPTKEEEPSTENGANNEQTNEKQEEKDEEDEANED